MNLLLRDYFRRWWWVILLTALGQMMLMEPSAKAQRMAPLLALFAGVIPLMWDVSRGHMRVLMQLPMRREKLATNYWLLVVVFPALVTFVASLAGQSAYAFSRPRAFADPMSSVINGLSAILICGTMLAAFSGKPTVGGGMKERLRTGLQVLIILFSVGGMIMMFQSWSSVKTTVAMVGFASFATWTGWRNRGHMIGGSAQSSRAYLEHLGTLTPRTHPRAPVGAGGWSYLIRTTAHAYAYMAALMFVMTGVLAYLFSVVGKAVNIFQLGQDPVEQFFSADSPFMLGVWMVLTAVSMRTVVQPRVWRMLPIRPGVLTGILMVTPLLLSFITMWLFFGFTWMVSDTHPEPAWSRSVQLALFFVVSVPVILRWGMSVASLGTLSAVFMLSAIIIPVMKGTIFPYLAAPALVVVLPWCYWLTHRLLTRSSAPYRSQPARFPMMSGQVQ